MIALLKGWVISICMCIFFITAIEMILPNNSLKKYAKFVLGLILITVLISPIMKLYDKNFNISKATYNSASFFDDKKYENNMNKYKQKNLDQTLTAFKKNLINLCDEKLKMKYPGKSYSIDIKVSYDKNKGNFNIDNVDIGVTEGKISSVKKIEIGTTSAVNNTAGEKVGNSEELKNLISSELKIPEDIIKIYKK